MTKYRVTMVVSDPDTVYSSFRADDVRGWMEGSGDDLPVVSTSIEVEEIFELTPGWYKYDGSLYKIWKHMGFTKGVLVKLPEVHELMGTLTPTQLGNPFTVTDPEGWKKAERIDL